MAKAIYYPNIIKFGPIILLGKYFAVLKTFWICNQILRVVKISRRICKTQNLFLGIDNPKWTGILIIISCNLLNIKLSSLSIKFNTDGWNRARFFFQLHGLDTRRSSAFHRPQFRSYVTSKGIRWYQNHDSWWSALIASQMGQIRISFACILFKNMLKFKYAISYRFWNIRKRSDSFRVLLFIGEAEHNNTIIKLRNDFKNCMSNIGMETCSRQQRLLQSLTKCFLITLFYQPKHVKVNMIF